MRCASAPAASPSSTPAAPAAAAELTLVRLSPEPGTTLTHASTIQAAFNYRLSNRKAKATYTLQPGFGDRLGAGYTFNSAGPTDVITLTSPGGMVEMGYPIIREWTNKRLARPIEIWFQIIETEQSRGRVLAEVGPYRYTAAPEDPK